MNIFQENIELTCIDGTVQNISDFEGKLVLIVNTASKCGFTKQFSGLEELYQDYKEQGLVILGFPCNQFKAQDPGSNDEILDFCQKNYGVSFPMFAKIDVNGDNRHPLYSYLIENSDKHGNVSWNFEKFLITKSGECINAIYP